MEQQTVSVAKAGRPRASTLLLGGEDNAEVLIVFGFYALAVFTLELSHLQRMLCF